MGEKDTVSIYQKLMKMRAELTKMKIKKSKYNTYSNFYYSTLEDFLPYCNELCEKYEVICLFKLEAKNSLISEYPEQSAQLEVVNCEDPTDSIVFRMPVANIQMKGGNNMQAIGGVVTYARRYLYKIAFEISEDDELDATLGKATQGPTQQPSTQGPTQQVDISKQVVNEVKVKVVSDRIKELGVRLEDVLNQYKISKLEDMTEEKFLRIMKALDKTEEIRNRAKQ